MPLVSYQYQVSIAAIFQNEAPYLSEWIDFHHLLGVEHFYLYNNLSNDAWEKTLRPYVRAGLVEVIDWPYESSSAVEWKPIQNKCYEDAVRRAKGETKWLALIDTDEFICPLKDENIPQFLKNYEPYAAVVVWWHCFGTSHVQKLGPGELLIEKLTSCAFKEAPENHHYKTICQPKRVRAIANAHQVRPLMPYKIVNEGKKSPKNGITKEKVQLNHYWTRDIWFMENEKIPRHDRWSGKIGKVNEREKQMSLSVDYAIQAFVPALKKFRD